jgi:hypothetical protein
VGIVRAFGTNTEDVSQGQFGQYPIYVFTSVGTWALEIGAGAVYITNVLPLNGEVIRDNYSKLNLSFGVAYITSEGLKIIAGKEIIEISESVEGLQDLSLSDNANIQFFLNHASIVQLLTCIDKVTFLTYIENAIIGYNKGNDNNELIVTNPAYDYSYVFDLKNKVWYKLSGQYSAFVHNYPELFAFNEDSNKVVNISVEEAGTTQCLIITRAHSFENDDKAKKLRRSIVRSMFKTTTDKFAAAYLFESDNLKTWKYTTGNDHNTGIFKDIWITHSLHSARYFAFVFAASLDVNRTSIDNRLNFIECEYEVKMADKLR